MCSARLVAARAARVAVRRASERPHRAAARSRGGRLVRLLAWRDPVAVVAELRALAPPARRGARHRHRHPRRRARARRRGRARAHRAPRRRRARGRLPRCRRRELRGGWRGSRRRCARRSSSPPPTSVPTTSARRPRPWRETLPQGQVVGQEVVPLRVAGLYVPGRPRQLPVVGAHDRHPGPGGGRRAPRRLLAAAARRRRGRRASPPPARCWA